MIRALFDTIHSAPQDGVYIAAGVLLLVVGVADRLLARRWSS